MGVKELTERIKNFATHEAGFDLVGISAASLPELHERALLDWTRNDFAGSMDYMKRDPARRAHPEKILPSAKTVVSLAMNYYHPEDEKPPLGYHGKVAKYAYGQDYHKVIEKKLKALSDFILKTAPPGSEAKGYVDTGLVLEKAFAQQAGLGFFGKNTNLITRHYGSWVFLASLITNVDLVVDAPHTGGCGSCRICIDTCPTEALLGNYVLDARRCISYLTIEDKTPLGTTSGPSFRERAGEWVFGCDVCQDVCPYNFRAKTTKQNEFYPTKKAGTWLNMEKIEILPGSPLKRAKKLKKHENV